MGRIKIHDSIDLDGPTLIEGLPGVGLVGKIATDHLVETLEMDHYASVYCDGIPNIGVYETDEQTICAPVRLFADADRNLVALRSEVPVSTSAAQEFASCILGWVADHDALPVFLSGRPAEGDGNPLTTERDGTPGVRGVATGDAGPLLDETGIEAPPETGAISGPTGALLHDAARDDVDGVGLIVESDPNFPDPLAARVLLERGIEPIADVDVAVEVLAERAAEIREQKQQLAQRMQQANTEESSQAKPLGMYQ